MSGETLQLIVWWIGIPILLIAGTILVGYVYNQNHCPICRHLWSFHRKEEGVSYMCVVEISMQYAIRQEPCGCLARPPLKPFPYPHSDD